uniref:Uncharacterized protein n=1 Tax=Kalanchoe fedtschenkoi TaxID=63787 RepID=A0A7N0R8R0_KALFE
MEKSQGSHLEVSRLILILPYLVLSFNLWSLDLNTIFVLLACLFALMIVLASWFCGGMVKLLIKKTCI